MPILTFKQLKESDVPGRIGVCPDSDNFRDFTNKATRMLMNRGDFWGTVERIKLCVYNSCLVWPRQVGTVLAVNLCGRPAEVFNHWYEFMPLSAGDFCGTGVYIGSGGFRWGNGACHGNVVVVNDGMSPVFNPIHCNQPRYIRVYPSTLEDIGKNHAHFRN